MAYVFSDIGTGGGLLVVTCIMLPTSLLLGVKFAMDSCKNAKNVVKEIKKVCFRFKRHVTKAGTAQT